MYYLYGYHVAKAHDASSSVQEHVPPGRLAPSGVAEQELHGPACVRTIDLLIGFPPEERPLRLLPRIQSN